jgi:hypothetical protein
MVVVSILSVGALIAFFFYHRVVITRIETSMHNVVAELDYFDEVIQTVRHHVADVERMVTPRSQVKKSTKKRGRPVNPNSVRQKKLKGIK